MIPVSFDYRRATSIDDALDALAANDGSMLIAGGHSLIPVLRFRLAQPARVVDIGRLAELKGISDHQGGVRIGAGTTYREVLASRLVTDRYPMLKEAIEVIGDTQVRNRGTIGGSLAHADPASDLPACMIVLDAAIELRSKRGTRTVPARAFFTGAFETVKAPDELLTAVIIPPLPAGAGTTYLKYEAAASGYAIAAVAAVITRTGGKITRADLAFTGIGDHSFLLPAGQKLVGTEGGAAVIAQVADESVQGVDITGDVHAPAEYRAHLAKVALRRAVERALSRAR
ncbi:MAG: FAD binding domain-containing protein [Gemmatimonadota bacterium]